LPSTEIQVVVAGHTCLDIIPTFPDTAETTIAALLTPGKLTTVGPLMTATGGAVPNTGLALHRLGIPTRLIGKIGDDLVGRAILDILRQHHPVLAEGMIITKAHPSSYTIVINPPGVDRIFLHCPGANDTFGADDVASHQLAGTRLFHFGYPPLMRRMYANAGRELETLLRRVKDQGLATSLDMARPDPASEAGRAPWPELLARVLPHVDIFLPSFDETLFMLDRPRFNLLERETGGDLIAAADAHLLRELADRLLSMGAAIVALKLGAQGIYLRTAKHLARLASLASWAPKDTAIWTDRELLAPCFQVQVVGTTGSGDCTIAGFLAGFLHRLPPEQVVTAAVAAGACNVEQPDATSGIPTWSILQQRLRSGWAQRPVSLPLARWRWEEENRLWRGPDDAPDV